MSTFLLCMRREGREGKEGREGRVRKGRKEGRRKQASKQASKRGSCAEGNVLGECGTLNNHWGHRVKYHSPWLLLLMKGGIRECRWKKPLDNPHFISLWVWNKCLLYSQNAQHLGRDKGGPHAKCIFFHPTYEAVILYLYQALHWGILKPLVLFNPLANLCGSS